MENLLMESDQCLTQRMDIRKPGKITQPRKQRYNTWKFRANDCVAEGGPWRKCCVRDFHDFKRNTDDSEKRHDMELLNYIVDIPELTCDSCRGFGLCKAGKLKYISNDRHRISTNLKMTLRTENACHICGKIWK